MTRGYMAFVYIMASDAFGTLYVGATSDLVKRAWEHREHVVDGFTKRYACTLLVYYEVHESMGAAILREKQIKKWERNWKIRLIMQENPHWTDLYDSIL
ncbi:MAG: endonuclease [Azospirillum brasilense]|nr:MAG: endonuclease [Azospirillum brasilense]